MKRIGILTAGGDTPALNATVYGAVTRANQLRVEVFGLLKGFNSLFNPRVPHVHLNPLFQPIPELDATHGGTLIGSSRDYVDANDTKSLALIAERFDRLKLEGLICVGGDGTLNGLQPLTEILPTVLAPKTIDNDLGLNYENEPNEWVRVADDTQSCGYRYARSECHVPFSLENMVNYVTPGFATSVFVSSQDIHRVRTTAESHRRIAIVEVMGRDSGYIALGTAYGHPDIILVPEHPINIPNLVDRIRELYELQKNVVIVVGEGITDEEGNRIGAQKVTDPAGNNVLSGAGDSLKSMLAHIIGDEYFRAARRGDTAREAMFTRKAGHTQRGGRPIQFDRFYAALLGGKSVDLLVENCNNQIATLQWSVSKGFYVNSFDANRFRDRYGLIHARQLHPSFYDTCNFRPTRMGIDYLLPIFTSALGESDLEHTRQTAFASGVLTTPYHSPNTDINKRIRYIQD
ncbi:MAG: 6-phosphofructokinase [Capsulimonadaceae bacterium]